MLARLFHFEGFTVLTAQNGEEALECFKQKRPDVVLVDFNLPDKNGLEVLKDLKALDAALHIFVMTGTHDERLPDKVRENGGTFVSKPMMVTELMEHVRLLLGNAT